MRRARRAILTVGALAALSASALGSVVAGTAARAEIQRLHWKARTIKVEISTSLTRPNTNIKFGSDVVGALQRSIQAWQAAADIEIVTEPTDKQSVSPSGVTGDGVSLITIASTPENVLFFSRDSDSASAKTRIFYNRVGYITEADIVLNPFQQFSTDGTFGTFDLESTLTHELGHLLGLRHSAVLGSTMADSFARMGTLGFADFSPRSLGESDIAALRDLYGPPITATECCATVDGRLSAKAGALRVWAEEGRTGRVMAQTDTSPDGSFSLGGLPGGTYSLFWKNVDDAIGQLGSVKLEPGDSRSLTERIAPRTESVAVQFVGLNGQLADIAAPVTGGRAITVYLGGKGLDVGSTVEFNSPFLSVAPGSAAKQDFGDTVSVVAFTVNVHPNTPPGEYTIFVTGEDGLRSCLIGGLTVE